MEDWSWLLVSRGSAVANWWGHEAGWWGLSCRRGLPDIRSCRRVEGLYKSSVVVVDLVSATPFIFWCDELLHLTRFQERARIIRDWSVGSSYGRFFPDSWAACLLPFLSVLYVFLFRSNPFVLTLTRAADFWEAVASFSSTFVIFDHTSRNITFAQIMLSVAVQWFSLQVSFMRPSFPWNIYIYKYIKWKIVLYLSNNDPDRLSIPSKPTTITM